VPTRQEAERQEAPDEGRTAAAAAAAPDDIFGGHIEQPDKEHPVRRLVQ